MKVLFIEPCFVDFGGYFRAINICSNLSKKGIQVDLLVASKKDFSFIIKKTKISDNLIQYELPRWNIHFFFNGRVTRGIAAFLFGLFGRYDIIHACVPVQLESNIPAVLLKLIGKKVVMDWDDYWEGSSIYGEYPLMKKYVAFCERKAPRFFENMVVVSDFLKDLSEKRGAKNVLKLINGVNPEQFRRYSRDEGRKKLDLDPNVKYLLTFGHTYINDRAYLLFKAFEEIYRLDPSIKLLFNYDPEKIYIEQKLEGRVNKECLKNIVNVGYIQQQDLGYYLGACDAVIFLMGDADNERACFPIRIGSYLNGEAIIIINDTNSEASNTLKTYDCAVVESEISTLAKRAVNVLNNLQEQGRLKENIKKVRSDISWENHIDKLIMFYKFIAEKRK